MTAAAWIACFGFAALGVSAWIFERAYLLHRDTLAEKNKMRRIVRMCREAKALHEYGAVDEAIELINRAYDEASN